MYFESNGISEDIINMGLLQNLLFRLNLVILLISGDIKSNQAPLKYVLSPTYYYPAVSADYWDIVFISQVQYSTF